MLGQARGGLGIERVGMREVGVSYTVEGRSERCAIKVRFVETHDGAWWWRTEEREARP